MYTCVPYKNEIQNPYQRTSDESIQLLIEITKTTSKMFTYIIIPSVGIIYIHTYLAITTLQSGLLN